MGKVLHSGPVLVVGRSHHFEDPLQLVSFLLAGKKRPHVDHFCEDTPDGPYIDGAGVFLRAQQDIRRPVPKRDYLVSEALHGYARCSSQSEISDFEDVVFRNKQILWLEVPMQNFLLVAMTDSFDELVGETFDYQRIHAFFLAEVVHVLFQVVLQIFKNQDKFPIGVDDFPQVDDVDVAELLENGYFADGR